MGFFSETLSLPRHSANLVAPKQANRLFASHTPYMGGVGGGGVAGQSCTCAADATAQIALLLPQTVPSGHVRISGGVTG